MGNAGCLFKIYKGREVFPIMTIICTTNNSLINVVL